MVNKDKKEKEDIFSFLGLKEMGIDKTILASIKPMIPKFIFDLTRGTPKFLLEEKNLRESIQNNTEQKRLVLNENIFSFRTILITITGFSLTIMGVALSVLSSTNQTIFKSSGFVYTGLVFLGLNVVGSILFIFYIYTKENNQIFRQINFNNELLSEANNLLIKYFKEGTFDQYLIEKNKLFETKKTEEAKLTTKSPLLIKGKDWTPHILGIFFLIGILLIIISIFI